MVINLGFLKITVERPGNIRRQVEAALKRGAVYGIKRHRELTGSSLRDAVAYVNNLLPANDRIWLDAKERGR